MIVLSLALGLVLAGDHVLYVSWGDQILIGAPADRLDTPAKIAASVPRWCAQADTGTIYWRTSDWRIQRDCVIRRDSIKAYWEAVDRALAAGDPYHAAVSAAHAAGRRIYAYDTLFDEGSPTSVKYGDSAPFPWESKLLLDHPEWLVCDRTGQQRHHGVPEYAYPEVRQAMRERFLTQVDQYGYDGVYLCTRTHSRPADRADQFGFNPPIVAEYQRRWGVDIRTAEFDVIRWENLRGEYLTLFLRELSGELRARGKRLAIGIPLGDSLGPPYGHLTLDWPTWVRERLIDELVIGVQSGNWHYPSLRGRDRERGYRFSGDEGWGLPSWEDEVTRRYGPLCRQHGVILRRPLGYSHQAVRLLGRLPIDGFMLDASGLAAAGGYLYAPDHPALHLAGGRFTLSLWVRPTAVTDSPRLLSHYDHTLPDHAGRGWELLLDETGAPQLRVNDGVRDHTVTAQTPLVAGRWTHLVAVSEGVGGRLRLFVDGQPDPRTAPAPDRVRATPVETVIGGYAGGGRPFRGEVADLRIFDAAHDPAALPAAGPTLVAWWDLGSAAPEIPAGGGRGPALRGVLIGPERRVPGPRPEVGAVRVGRE